MLGYQGSGIYLKIVALYLGGGKERDTMFRCVYVDKRTIILWKLFFFALLSFRFCHCMCFFVVPQFSIMYHDILENFPKCKI